SATKPQGCESASYPGSSSKKHPQPQRGCGNSISVADTGLCHNRVAVESIYFRTGTQGSSTPRNLGLGSQSRWRVLRNSEQEPVVAEQSPKKGACEDFIERPCFGGVAAKVKKPL